MPPCGQKTRPCRHSDRRPGRRPPTGVPKTSMSARAAACAVPPVGTSKVAVAPGSARLAAMAEEGAPSDLSGFGVENVLGPLGSAVMRVVWAHGEVTVGAVVKAINATGGRQLAYNTLMTIMGRLYQRGFLTRTTQGRTYVYRAAAPEAELLTALSGRAVDQVLARYGEAALRHFAARLGEADPGLRAELMKLASRRPRL